jgi:hypothetical protein
MFSSTPLHQSSSLFDIPTILVSIPEEKNTHYADWSEGSCNDILENNFKHHISIPDYNPLESSCSV